MAQKPYACTEPFCSKRYTDPSSLRKHQKTHSSGVAQHLKKKVSALKRTTLGLGANCSRSIVVSTPNWSAPGFW